MDQHPLVSCRHALIRALTGQGAPSAPDRLVLQPALGTAMTLTCNAADLATNASALVTGLPVAMGALLVETRMIGRRLSLRLDPVAVAGAVLALRALPEPGGRAQSAHDLVVRGARDAPGRIACVTARCRSIQGMAAEFGVADAVALADAGTLSGDLPQPLHDLLLLLLFRDGGVSGARLHRGLLRLCDMLETAWRTAPPGLVMRSFVPGDTGTAALARYVLIDLAARVLHADAPRCGLSPVDRLL